MNVKRFQSLLAASLVAALGFGVTATAAEKENDNKLNVGGVEADGAGSVSGVVFFDGRKVKRRPVDVSADDYCVKQHKDEPVLSKRWIFGQTEDEKDTLVNVFVYVSKGVDEDEYEAPDATNVLDQEGCEYIPHVSGTMAKQKFIVRNSDATLHNVNMQSQDNGSLNIGQPAKGMEKEIELKKPEMGVRFKCDVHPWMGAYLHVMAHPFYAVTQHDGSFTLEGLKPGKYTISVWHEFDKFSPVKNDIEVEVKEGETAKVDFTYEPPKRRN